MPSHRRAPLKKGLKKTLARQTRGFLFKNIILYVMTRTGLTVVKRVVSAFILPVLPLILLFMYLRWKIKRWFRKDSSSHQSFWKNIREKSDEELGVDIYDFVIPPWLKSSLELARLLIIGACCVAGYMAVEYAAQRFNISTTLIMLLVMIVVNVYVLVRWRYVEMLRRVEQRHYKNVLKSHISSMPNRRSTGGLKWVWGLNRIWSRKSSTPGPKKQQQRHLLTKSQPHVTQHPPQKIL